MKCRFSYILSMLSAVAALCLTSCSKNVPEVVEETLEVSPSSLSFEATDNADAFLTVTTNASEWSFTKSSWITASQSGDKLTVNCSDNSSRSSREGWIKIKAGSAEPITVKVSQKGTEEQGGEIVTPEGEDVSLLCAGGDTYVKIVNETEVVISVIASIPTPASEPVTVTLFADADRLDTFNAADVQHIRKAVLLASDKTTMPENCTITIPAGRSESDVLEIRVDVSDFAYDERHLLPLHLEAVENAAVSEEGRADFIICKPKPIKNIVCFEVNDTNPLNALEYKLEDGAMFFDAAVLFSANIISSGGASLHNNANVQALLDEKAIYLQPLRDAGIKVYLGLLGHHTPAGLCGLSDWGARQFAEEVAEACYVYGLDGVFLDDEYSNYESDPTSEWYAPRSIDAGARLCYELKRAMKEKCPWETDVSVFVYGSFSGKSFPTVTDDGVEYPQSWFIDSLLPAYGVPTVPSGDLTRAQCAYNAFELNKGNAPIYAECAEAVTKGYGYCMWFAFHPSDKGNINNNLERSLGYFRTASQAIYGQNVLDPKYCYDKLGEGLYDPTPHAL